MQLKFTQEELLTDHEYAKPHRIGDKQLHGGFLANAEYQPPRSKIRSVAVANWTAALQSRNGDLLEADSSLLDGPRVPNVEQQCLLIRKGIGHFFWNGLTITGKNRSSRQDACHYPVSRSFSSLSTTILVRWRLDT